MPGETWLKETSIGNSGDIYPKGTGRLLRAGAVIRFNIHYHPVGEEVRDRTSIAFRFYSKAGDIPTKKIVSRFITARNLDIPLAPATYATMDTGPYRSRHRSSISSPHALSRPGDVA